MRSNKNNWVTLLILAIVVFFIFLKEDAFSKEKENYIEYLSIYNKEIPLEKEKREYAINVEEINIKKIGENDNLPICTCDITRIIYDEKKYEILTDTTFDYEKKEVIISIYVKGANKTLDTYKILVKYQKEINIEDECQKEYSCLYS